MFRRATLWLMLAGVSLVAHAQTPTTAPSVLKYGDGKPDGQESIGGSGEMIRFVMPEGRNQVLGISIHGSRYGTAQPPDENVTVYILGEDPSQIIHIEEVPYRQFDRGNAKWTGVTFKSPIEVPGTFWVAVDFHAERTKGVYVSYDTSTKGEFSKVGLPGSEVADVKFAGDWMILARVGTK